LIKEERREQEWPKWALDNIACEGDLIEVE
jgi:hypothetical protein